MPTLKVFDLAFYEGFNKDNRILYSNQLLNALPFGNSVYPFPEFQTDVGFPAIDVSVADAIISYKIQNNNLILDDGSPAEALLLAAMPTAVTNQLTADIKVAHKNVGGEGTYGLLDFTFTYTGRAQTGTIQGLTAFGITFSPAAIPPGGTDTFYVGFISGVASYNFNGAALPTEGTLVSLPQLKIVDLAVDPTTELIYIIENDAFYSLNFGTSTLTPIPITTFPSATDFKSIATDDTYVYIVANEGFTADSKPKTVMLIYEIATGIFVEILNSIVVNKVIYDRGVFGFGGINRPLVRCSDSEGCLMSSVFTGGTTFSNELLVNTSNFPNLSNNVINDVSQRISNTNAAVLGVMFATDAGSSYGSQQGSTLTIEATTLFPTTPTPLVALAFNDISAVPTGTFSIVVGETDGDNLKSYSLNYATGGVSNINNFPQSSAPLALASNKRNPLATSGNDYWIASRTGQGIVTSNAIPNNPNLVLTVLSDTYELKLRDAIKTDVEQYYFLLNEIGTSDLDANALLLSFQTNDDTLRSGGVGYFLPTNKLWVAGDVFILNNVETPTSFYYKTLDSLSLNLLNNVGTGLTSESEGLINTTEAGEVVDLIYTRSLFYLLGTRGIEVWQNQGASGFPYRKESYLTIPYHLLPLSDQNLYRFELNRWAYFNGGYAIATLSNEDNEFQIIVVKSGHYQVFPLNKAAWYAALNQVGTSAPDDLTLNVVNMWGKEYIIISKINSRTLGTRSAALIIDEQGKISALPDATTDQIQFLTATSTNGIRTIYDEGLEEFTLEVAPQFPSTLALNTMTLQSNLLKPFAENVLVKTLIIQYAFPIADVSSYPAGTFDIAWSDDEGRSFGNTLVTAEPWANNLNNRQLIYQINATVPSFMLQFVSTTPIIIESAVVSYQETGLRG